MFFPTNTYAGTIRKIKHYTGELRKARIDPDRYQPGTIAVYERWINLLSAKARAQFSHDADTYRNLKAGNIGIASQEDYEFWGTWAKRFERASAAR